MVALLCQAEGLTQVEIANYMRRGRRNRISNIKEQFQVGVMHAISSAAGCAVAPEPIDTGLDVTVNHERHGITDRITIGFQLKCTEVANPSQDFVIVKVSKQRFLEYSAKNKTQAVILVAQVVSVDHDCWIGHDSDTTKLSARSYWINLTGMPTPPGHSSDDIRVKVPIANVFDDSSLIHLFALERAGKLPK